MPNPLDGESEELRKLIINILTNSKKVWEKIEREQKRKFLDKKDEVAVAFMECNVSVLTEATKDKRFGLQDKYRIFLPPLEDDPDFLPLLTFKWNFDAGNGECGFFLDLAKNNHQILSLRFEKGNNDGDGDHNYLHMQINNRINDLMGQHELDWLPDHHPHVLLRSEKYPNSPIILLLYLLGSLYGFRDFYEKVLYNIHQKYKQEMRAFCPN